MKSMKAFGCRRRRELVLVGAAICAMGIITSKSVSAADLDVGPGYPGGVGPGYPGGVGPSYPGGVGPGYPGGVGPSYPGGVGPGYPGGVGPGYPGGYYEHPYPYPPRVQGYQQYEGPPIYYPRPRYYHPYAWADPDNGYRYGQPHYLYSPYVDRPPAPVPFAADPRAVPPPDDLLAEESPGYGWQRPAGW
jgi:hypothetical protein